ncbi:MAG: CotH kinase family protein, partial [Prevotellaceae bacterium]|nr:CotH kinase family protein [Prevotellaceae bacterium]
YSDNAYSLPAKIHSPDLTDDGVQLTAEAIIEDFNEMVRLVASGTDTYLLRVDAASLARYLLACELIVNREVEHPKSVYLFSEDVTDCQAYGEQDATPWHFGPLWDCDYDFGYGASKQYFRSYQTWDYYDFSSPGKNSKGFFQALRQNATAVDSLYYCLMTQFYEGGGLDELLDYCDEYYAFAASSFQHNRENDTSSKDTTDYALQAQEAKQWLRDRASYVLSQLTPYSTDDYTGLPAVTPQAERRQPPGDTYYDLSGRPVAKPTQRGVYIKGGRKVFLR